MIEVLKVKEMGKILPRTVSFFIKVGVIKIFLVYLS